MQTAARKLATADLTRRSRAVCGSDVAGTACTRLGWMLLLLHSSLILSNFEFFCGHRFERLGVTVNAARFQQQSGCGVATAALDCPY